MANWQTRIVGHEDVDPKALVPNPQNWRTHPKAQRAAMGGALDEIGWVQSIIVNKRSGNIIDGHLRVELALGEEAATVPVVYVDLSDDEERLALATLDPLGAMAGRNDELFASLTADLSVGNEALASLIAPLVEPEKPEYVQEVRSPIYEPSGPKPRVAQLYDDSKTEALLAEIDALDIPKDVKAFLRSAAGRHTVLHFDQIANFYAHAEPVVQRLMEASALVIIDARQAIEHGFLRLNQAILDAFDEDYPDAR